MAKSAERNLIESERYRSARRLRARGLTYDLCIVGSDQVLNPNIHQHGLWLRLLDTNNGPEMKRVMYAASMGLDAVPAEHEALFARCLAKFDGISVREEQTARAIAPYVKWPIHHHIDPVFLLDEEQWRQFATQPIGLDEPFVFVHILKEQPGLMEFVREISVRKECRVLASSARQSKNGAIRLRAPLSPEEFVWCICNAEYVVTNSFHGMALSVHLRRPVRAFVPETGKARLTEFLRHSQLSRICSDDIPSDAERSRMYDRAGAWIDLMRKDALAYLRAVTKQI